MYSLVPSPSCQSIVRQELSSLSASHMIIRSCMGHPSLRPAITQHKCNGVALNPGGLYLDMALTVAKFLWQHHNGSDVVECNVHELEIHKPLVVRDENKMDDLWLEMETTVAGANDVVLRCVFWSITKEGVRLQENGTCKVSFESSSDWLSDWANHYAAIKDRIDSLYTRAQKETSGNVQLVQRKTAYELFQSFVDYGEKYQNMSEVVFDGKTLEATAILRFQPDPEVDFVGPFYLDGSCHISGFVCNAVEQQKDKFAFISNGVGAMKLSSKFRPEVEVAEIRTYVRMQPLANDKSVLAGDVYVLQDGEIVGLWESVRFKKIPRRVLNVFLPPPRK